MNLFPGEQNQSGADPCESQGLAGMDIKIPGNQNGCLENNTW